MRSLANLVNVDLFLPEIVDKKNDTVICPVRWNLWSIEAVMRGDLDEAKKNTDFEYVSHPVVTPKIKWILEKFNASILLYNDFECRDLTKCVHHLRSFARCLGLTPNQVYYSTSEYMQHMKVQNGQICSYDWGFVREQSYFQKENIIPNIESKKYRIISLNYRSTAERFAYCLFMYTKHQKRFNFSYLQKVDEDISLYEHVKPDIFTTENNNRFRRLVPKLLDGDNPDQHQVLTIRHFLEQASINVIFETNFEGTASNAEQVSEKTYKGIKTGKPFLLFTTKGGVLRHLRRLGFKTFEPHIDESYDNPRLSYVQRYKLLLEESDRICSISDTDFIELEQKLQPIVDFNLVHLETGDIPNIFQIICDDSQSSILKYWNRLINTLNLGV